MTTELDLNINNYRINELEGFLGLNNDYSFNDILKREKNMTLIITDSSDYDENKKKQIIRFINSAREKIVLYLKNELNQTSDLIEDTDRLIIESDEKHVINKTSVNSGGNHFVMNRESTSFNDTINPNKYLNPAESFPTNVARSYLNNLKRKVINQTLVLNSLFREDYLNTPATDFILILPNYFKNVLSLRLSSVQLPNVFYCINSSKGNNSLYLSEVSDDGSSVISSGVVLVPDGNYDILGFIAALNAAIAAQLSTNFIVSYNESSQKITIVNSVYTFIMNFTTDYNPATDITTNVLINNCDYKNVNCVDITELYKRLGWIIGFRKAYYSGNYTYTTESIFNGIPTNYVYFILNDFNNSQSQNIMGLFSKSIIGNNILGMIPLTTKSYTTCFNTGNDLIEKKRNYFGPVNLQKIKIQLLDQYGDVLNLNNMDFSFSLELEIGYDW